MLSTKPTTHSLMTSGQAVRIRLKRVRSDSGFRIDCSKPFVRIESIGQKAGDEIFGVLILQVNQVACAVEREAVLRKRTAETANGRFFFQNDRFVFEEVMAGAHARKAATDDDNSFHDRISTFINR